MDKYKEYIDLLSMNYNQAVNHLLKKYGPAKDHYFIEESYTRFLKGEVKKPTRGKYTRTSKGLYCHHIDESKWLNIADHRFIREYEIPFEYQHKERLVYCDLIEHTILHALIAKETSGHFGQPGYEFYLKPTIEEWYIEKKIPTLTWMKNCYEKAFLTPEEAVNLLKTIQVITDS